MTEVSGDGELLGTGVAETALVEDAPSTSAASPSWWRRPRLVRVALVGALAVGISLFNQLHDSGSHSALDSWLRTYQHPDAALMSLDAASLSTQLQHPHAAALALVCSRGFRDFRTITAQPLPPNRTLSGPWRGLTDAGLAMFTDCEHLVGASAKTNVDSIVNRLTNQAGVMIQMQRRLNAAAKAQGLTLSATTSAA